MVTVQIVTVLVVFKLANVLRMRTTIRIYDNLLRIRRCDIYTHVSL